MANPGWRLQLIGWIGVILCVLGIGVTTDLTIAHYTTPTLLVCPETGIINCAKVTTSSYSEIAHVPLALLGLGFFVVMLVLQLPPVWRIRNPYLIWGRAAMAVSGILMVFWLVYVELYRLNAICLYCSATHILSFGLFVTTALGTAWLVE